MKSFDEKLVLETINMIRLYNLDIRTVTLALSLRDCISEDIDKLCDNIYNKIKTPIVLDYHHHLCNNDGQDINNYLPFVLVKSHYISCYIFLELFLFLLMYQ